MPESLSPQMHSLRARIAAHDSWAETSNRSARTAAARAAFDAKFLEQAEGTSCGPPPCARPITPVLHFVGSGPAEGQRVDPWTGKRATLRRNAA